MTAAAQVGFREIFLFGEPADEPAGKRIARARRIEHVFERNRGREKMDLPENNSAPCSPFFTRRVSDRALDFSTGFYQAELFRQFAGFRVVDDNHVHAFERFQQFLRFALYPEVHRVAHDEPGFVYLVEHAVLGGRERSTSRTNVSARPIGRRDAGIERRGTRSSRWQAYRGCSCRNGNLPCQWNVSPSGTICKPSVSMKCLWNIRMVCVEIPADHADKLHPAGEVTGGKADEGGGAADKALRLLKRRFHRIERDGAYDANYMKTP